jgi:hypothetical protein
VTGPPLVDERRVVAGAPADAVWASVVRHFTAPRRRGRADLLAVVLGAEPRGEGTMPGFGVAEEAPPRRLRLAGRHRFSRYALEFVVTPGPGGTALSARTYAEFPGPHGAAYRALVIRSGVHAVVTRRMLRQLAAAAAGAAAR